MDKWVNLGIGSADSGAPVYLNICVYMSSCLDINLIVFNYPITFFILV